MKTISRIVLLVLAVVTLATLLFGIGTIPLRDPYEAAYGEVAREMAQAGSYLSPRLFDQFLPGVPPLSYVLSAFCVRIFGATEWAVRLPSALLLAALTVLLYAAVTHTFNERAGFWSGMVFATSLLTSYFVKTSVTDSTLVFFVTAALLCFIRGHYWLLYVAAALSVLSDGPIALVFPAVIIGLYLLLSGKMYLLGRMHFFRGILLVFVLCAPWAVFQFHVYGASFASAFLAFPDFGMPFLATQAVVEPLWFYLPVLLGGIFPWTGLLVKSLKDTICESGTADLENLLFFHLWWIFVFLFFTFTGTRVLASLLLAFPPLAVLIGWNLDRMPREDRGHYGGWALASLLAFAVAAFAWLYCFRGLPALSFVSLILSAMTVLCGMGIGIALLGYRDAALGKWLHAAAGILTMIVVYSFFLPLLQDTYSVRALARQYAALSPQEESASLYVEHDYRPGVSFYAQRPGQELNPKDAATVRGLWRDKGPKYVILSRQTYEQLKGTIGGEAWHLEGEKQGVCLFSYLLPVPIVAAPAEPREEANPAVGPTPGTASRNPNPAAPSASRTRPSAPEPTAVPAAPRTQPSAPGPSAAQPAPARTPKQP